MNSDEKLVIINGEQYMKLREYLKNQSFSVSKVAKILDVPEVTVNSWKYGNKIPSKKNMDKIVEFTNKEVQPNDFYT